MHRCCLALLWGSVRRGSIHMIMRWGLKSQFRMREWEVCFPFSFDLSRSLSISMSSASSMPSGSPVFIGCLKYTHLSTSPRLALSQQSLVLDGSIGAFWVWFPCSLSLGLGSCRLGSGAWRMGSEANSLTDNDEGQILKPYCLFFSISPASNCSVFHILIYIHLNSDINSWFRLIFKCKMTIFWLMRNSI